MSTPTDHKVYTTMRNMGGNFCTKLAEAWFAGDPENRALIKSTWPDYYKRYLKLTLDLEVQAHRDQSG